MDKKQNPLYSANVMEFVAAANEFCKYAENASEIKGSDLLKILQRLLPFIYIKASLLPALEPVFEDGNEKVVTEADWDHIHDAFRKQFGSADDYLELYDKKINETEDIVPSSISEDMADIYQDLKDFLIPYQTGTEEVMNDALWECRMNFENIWGQKLVNSMRAIHRSVYSEEESVSDENFENETNRERDTSEWFISKRQKEFGGDVE